MALFGNQSLNWFYPVIKRNKDVPIYIYIRNEKSSCYGRKAETEEDEKRREQMEDFCNSKDRK